MKLGELTQLTEGVIRNTAPLRIRRELKSVESRLGKKPDFVILSTGRAGSTYTAYLLKQFGIRCSHEMFFTPEGFYKSLRYDGDSSWLAVPYLEKDPNLTKKVLHQVRNPLDVVSSLYGIGFFNPDNNNPFAQFVRENFEVTGDELRDCVRFWTAWNIRSEALSQKTYLFEDLIDNPNILMSELGVDIREPDYREKIKSISKKKVNSRKRIEVSLDQIPDSEDRQKMLTLAERYGYFLQ